MGDLSVAVWGCGVADLEVFVVWVTDRWRFGVVGLPIL
jgi:hypothetical protein